jgi:demethylmenaquinone methyltransferase/2-methoxy-6-polyprenyl-1,4-benzoquinol methylase
MPEAVAVRNLFARIAGRYDLANHVLSGGVDLIWRARLVAAVRRAAPGDVLDLATGSGDVALALARALPPETRITGMDFCQPMLDRAELKKAGRRSARYTRVAFQLGDGLALPLADASFDAVTIAFGLRNMADRAGCLTEMRRVLRPGGRLFVLEFSQPDPWFQPIYRAYLRRVTPRLAAAVTGERTAYDYLGDSIEAFPDRAGLTREIAAAGWSQVRATPMTFGIVALHQARAWWVAAPGSVAPVS